MSEPVLGFGDSVASLLFREQKFNPNTQIFDFQTIVVSTLDTFIFLSHDWNPLYIHTSIVNVLYSGSWIKWGWDSVSSYYYYYYYNN